ncbi:MAG: hypothetical protein MRZ54_01065, partial [Clostridiales bacterium]|nr:hypothetical protein [Clostridiales bacterium]
MAQEYKKAGAATKAWSAPFLYGGRPFGLPPLFLPPKSSAQGMRRWNFSRLAIKAKLHHRILKNHKQNPLFPSHKPSGKRGKMPIVPGRPLFQTAYGTPSTFYVPSEELAFQ